MKIIRKSKIGWVLSEDSIVAFDRIQATIYHTYELTNRQPFDRMKLKIMMSGPEEYNSWVDVLDLAVKEGIRGYGTRLKQEWFES